MECEHQFVSTTKRKAVTPQGIFSVLGVLVGLGLLLVNPLVGLIVIVVAGLVGAVGRSKAVILCAKCGQPAPHQP